MISEFFIKRPIVAMVISIVTVIMGIVAMRSLPLAQFPSIVPPQIIVSTSYTGADALTIEQSVSTPLEQQMNGVDDMLYMQSTNANDGSESLTVTFDINKRAMTRSFWPTTPTSTSTTRYIACREWAKFVCSAQAITPCASGSSRMCWPNWACRSPT